MRVLFGPTNLKIAPKQKIVRKGEGASRRKGKGEKKQWVHFGNFGERQFLNDKE